MLPQKARRRAQTRDLGASVEAAFATGYYLLPLLLRSSCHRFRHRPWYGLLGRLPIRCLASDLRVKFRAANRFVSNGVDQLPSQFGSDRPKLRLLARRRARSGLRRHGRACKWARAARGLWGSAANTTVPRRMRNGADVNVKIVPSFIHTDDPPLVPLTPHQEGPGPPYRSEVWPRGPAWGYLHPPTARRFAQIA